jgi:hypothetical protein
MLSRRTVSTVVPRFTATGTFDRLLIGTKVVNEFSEGTVPEPLRRHYISGLHPEIFGFASGSGIVPLSGLDFFLDFSADPINRQTNYFAINGTGGANPDLLSVGTSSFLVQPVPLLLPSPSSPPV